MIPEYIAFNKTWVHLIIRLEKGMDIKDEIHQKKYLMS